MSTLFEDEKEAEKPVKLTIDKEFAKKYEAKKKREELGNLKEKYGDVVDEEESSSSEEEDEYAEEDTPGMEEDFLRTLSLIKGDDPRIYDNDVKLYVASEKESPKSKAKAEKPVFLKDHERKRLLTKGDQAFVSDDEDDENDEKAKAVPGSYNAEQAKLKKAFHAAVEGGDDNDDDDDDLLTEKSKTQAEKDQEEHDFQKWLQGEGAALAQETAQDLAPLRQFWTDQSLGDGDQFLRDYITQRMWKANELEYDVNLEEEAEDDVNFEKAEEFEHKYNFRFEEEGGDQIVNYPRNIDTSVRQKDDKRKREREAKALRKKQEEEERRRELQRMKQLKQGEIRQKMELIAEAAGVDPSRLDELDLDMDGDFDPEKFEEQLGTLFNDDYYEDEAAANEKPDFGEYDLGDYGEDEEEDFNMDADYVPSKREKKKKEKGRRKKKGKRGEEEVQVDPSKSLKELVDEYQDINYEELAGTEEVKFRYREVVPNDYGLSIEEILAADDKELNAWVSVKKMSQYRTKEDEEYEVRKYRKRAKKKEKKKQILPSIAPLVDGVPLEAMAAEIDGANEDAVQENGQADEATTETTPKKSKKEKRKKKRKAKRDNDDKADIDDPADNDNTAGSTAVSNGHDSDSTKPARKKPKKSKKTKETKERSTIVKAGVPISKERQKLYKQMRQKSKKKHRQEQKRKAESQA